MDTPLVVIGGESIQLSTQVETVPEEGLVEILAPKSSDESLDERMRTRHKRDRLQFLDVQNSQIRSPTMKPE
jgi:hypothetical protein